MTPSKQSFASRLFYAFQQFEFIQRKGDDGFGEGNFKALFESIEAEDIANGDYEHKEGVI